VRQKVRLRHGFAVPREPGSVKNGLLCADYSYQERPMNTKRTALILATVAAIGATAVSAPAEARHRGWGPGIGFGLAAGALAAGAFAASQPYYL
jgi:hypothetical protein